MTRNGNLMHKDPLVRTTLLTAAAMVGACVLFVGTLSLAAVLVTSRMVGGPEDVSNRRAVTFMPGVKS